MHKQDLKTIFSEGKYFQYHNQLCENQQEQLLENQKYHEILSIDNSNPKQESQTIFSESLKHFRSTIGLKISTDLYSLYPVTPIQLLCENISCLEQLKYLDLDLIQITYFDKKIDIFQRLSKSILTLKHIEYINLGILMHTDTGEEDAIYFCSALASLKTLVSLNVVLIGIKSDENTQFISRFCQNINQCKDLKQLSMKFTFLKQENTQIQLKKNLFEISPFTNLTDLTLEISDKGIIDESDLNVLNKSLQNLTHLTSLSLTLTFEEADFIVSICELVNQALIKKSLENLFIQVEIQYMKNIDFKIGYLLSEPSTLKKLSLIFKTNNSMANSFKIFIDEKISYLSNLSQLELDMNSFKLSDESFVSFGMLFKQLQKLEKLQIKVYFDLEDDTFIEFGKSLDSLRNLEYLELDFILRSYTLKQYGFMNGISNLEKLQTLKIHSFYTFLQEDFNYALEKLSNLKEFSIQAYFQVSNEELLSLGKALNFLRGLHKLSIQIQCSNSINDLSTIQESISHMVELQNLDIGLLSIFFVELKIENSVIIPLLHHLINLTKLKELSLRFRCEVHDKTLLSQPIIKLESLRRLTASFNQSVTLHIIKKHKRLVCMNNQI